MDFLTKGSASEKIVVKTGNGSPIFPTRIIFSQHFPTWEVPPPARAGFLHFWSSQVSVSSINFLSCLSRWAPSVSAIADQSTWPVRHYNAALNSFFFGHDS